MLVLTDTGLSAWLPTSVTTWEEFLAVHIKVTGPLNKTKCKGLVKNVAYALQHLEFINRCESDLVLTTVVKTMNRKGFIIEGCAIIEAMFYYLLIDQGHAATVFWEKVQDLSASEFDVEGARYKQESSLFRKLSKPVLTSMTFDRMLKLAERKDIVGLGHEFHKRLPYLKSIRNRVHLHILESSSDTDYLKISLEDFTLMKGTLLSLFRSPAFGKGAGLPSPLFLES